MILSNRLQTVANLVSHGGTLVDIGSDHAYLPIYLLSKQRISDAIAGEVVEGPFQNACREVKKAKLENKISVRFGDGLDIIQAGEQFHTLTICGMGGSLISKILMDGFHANKLRGTESLILQANQNEKAVRKLLQENNYQIVEELIIEEKKVIYEIIKAEPGSSPVHYSPQELYFGPIQLMNKPPLFYKKWQEEMQKKITILKSMEKAKHPIEDKIQALKNEIQEIEEVL